MKKILAAAVLLIFIAGMVCFAQTSSDTVIIVSFAGDVRVFPIGQIDSIECKLGLLLEAGTRIVTGEESFAEIAFDRSRENVVRIKEKSEVVIKLDGSEKIELIDGEVFTLLQKLEKGNTFRVRTPNAVCGARGTGWKTTTHGDVTNVSVFQNKVFVRGINKDGSVMEEQHWVEEGFERRVEKFERPGKMEKIADAKFSKMVKELEHIGLRPDRMGIRRRDTLKPPMERVMKQRERMEHRIERQDLRREEFRRNILDQRDDTRLEEIRGTRDDRSGNDPPQ